MYYIMSLIYFTQKFDTHLEIKKKKQHRIDLYPKHIRRYDISRKLLLLL